MTFYLCFSFWKTTLNIFASQHIISIGEVI